MFGRLECTRWCRPGWQVRSANKAPLPLYNRGKTEHIRGNLVTATHRILGGSYFCSWPNSVPPLCFVRGDAALASRYVHNYLVTDYVKALASVFGIVTSLWDGRPEVWFESRRMQEIFPFPECPDWLWGLPSFLFETCRCLSPGVKWSARQTDHSTCSSVQSTRPHGLIAWTGTIITFMISW
jgi:hypothetical protein